MEEMLASSSFSFPTILQLLISLLTRNISQGQASLLRVQRWAGED